MPLPRSHRMLTLPAAMLALSLLLPLPRHAARAAQVGAGRPGALVCTGGLTLSLQPGIVPPADAAWNGPPARDLPPGPLLARLPLYPGAAPSSTTMPAHALTGLPPGYRKVARAEYQVDADYRTVSAWYRAALAACRLTLVETMPLQQHGGPRFAGLGFETRDGLGRVTLVFRPLAPRLTALLCFAQELDLPPRPVASLLRGPFPRVEVDYRAGGPLPASHRHDRFTLVWPPTVNALVQAIDRPTRMWVPIGSGGTVVFSQSATLSFVRRDGTARRVFVGGVLDRLVVGHTRPLVDPDGAVLRLVARLVSRRCARPGACG